MHHTLVIGAGAAGLAAASTLQAAGASVQVLEARNRLGGRIWTDRSWDGIPIENGAEFIHGDQAITWKWVEQLQAGTIAIDRSRSYAYEVAGQLRHCQELLDDPGFAQMFALEDQDFPEEHPPDISFADWLAQQGIPNPGRHIVAEMLANSYLTTADAISVAELAHEARIHHAGKGDFRWQGGYDQLVQVLSQGLEIALNTAVTTVDWQSRPMRVTVQTANGDTQDLSADQVVVTVPLALLQQNVIEFCPALPTAKQTAINALKMGDVVKLHLEFQKSFWPVEMSLFTSSQMISMWWSSSYQQPERPPLLTAFIGGPNATLLSQMTEAEAIEVGLTDLCRLFGDDALRQTYVRGRRIAWSHDPWARGGYSFVPPGAFGARHVLEEQIDNVLFFAGEATVTHSNPSTVHGAIDSGLRVAQAILANYIRA
jgi:monoamine oxidase